MSFVVYCCIFFLFCFCSKGEVHFKEDAAEIYIKKKHTKNNNPKIKLMR